MEKQGEECRRPDMDAPDLLAWQCCMRQSRAIMTRQRHHESQDSTAETFGTNTPDLPGVENTGNVVTDVLRGL